MANFRRKAFFIVFMVILGVMTIAISETTLWIAASIWKTADLVTSEREPVVRDEQGSIIRGNPLWPNHDTRGFRNPSTLDHADMVALGDSHTYGTNVALQNSWPQVLSIQLGSTVYSMAIPGTGPLQSAELISDALQLRPNVILFGLYFGNDLADDFRLAMTRGRLTDFIADEDVKEIYRLERVDPQPNIFAVLRGAPDFAKGDSPFHVGFYGETKKFLEKHSRLYVLLRSFKRYMFPSNTIMSESKFEDAVSAISEHQKPYISVFSEGGWKSILTPAYRLPLMQLSDVRIRSGMAIAMQASNVMSKKCRENNVRFIVVLLPTKESAFLKKMSDSHSTRDYDEAVTNENKIRLNITTFFLEKGIEFIDPLESLRSSTVQPYPENADGHPNVVGHEIIASVIRDYLQKE